MLNTPNLNSVTNILWVQLSEIQFFYKNLLIMKKLNLEMLRLTSADVLEGSQMKKITGGYGSGSCTVCYRYNSSGQINGTYTSAGSCQAGGVCYNDPNCFTWSCH